jgi:putative transposase
VSKSNVDPVSGYIDRQKEHHRSRGFKDEFLRLLEKHEVEYDERYVWD